MALLRLSLLGAPEIQHDGRAVAFPTRKALALLVYLAVEEGRHTREKIAGLLWPDSQPEQARGSLRYTLAALRSALDESDGDAHCVAERGLLAFNGDVPYELDTWELERAQAASELERLVRATDAWRGEFLDGFTLRDAPEFEDWLVRQRGRWRGRVSAAFDRLSNMQWKQGDASAATSTAAHWARADPLDEAAQRRLMLLQLITGDATAALHTHGAYRALLNRELGVEPASPMESLARRARQALMPTANLAPKLPESRAAAFDLPLVGRAAELDIGVELYHAASQGRSRLLLLQGEAGIGKTRLADELLAWAGGHGADVLRGRAFETGGHLPYQPLLDAFRPRLERENAPDDLLSDVWLAELSRLLPELGERYPDLALPTGDEMVARMRLFEALARLGQALADRAPLVLFVDDVQWADAASLDVLRYLARRWGEAATRVLVVLSVRAEALDSTSWLRDWLLGLRREIDVTRLELAPLDVDATRALVRQLAGSGHQRAELPHELDDFARWLFAETAGQPFFVAETLRALVERGALSRVPARGGRWAVVPRADVLREVTRQPFVSPEVRDVVRARVARLNPSTRTLLSAASVLGQAFEFPQLCQVADLDEASALPALDEALSAHLLREVPADGSVERSVYSIAHDKLRDVVYQETTEARRRVFHRRALESSAADTAAAELAHHALAAGLKEQGLRYSAQAGDEAQRVLAAHDAIGHYSTAIALAEAARLRDQLADLRVRRAQAYASIGRWADAREELTAVLPTLPSDDEERRAELLVQLSAAHFWLLDIPGLRPHATEAVTLASRVQRGDLEMSARGWLAGAEGGDGRLVASIEQYDRTVARARELGSNLPANVLTMHALVLYWLGRLDEATERSSAGVAAARLANDASILMYSLPHLGLALAARGRYAEAQATFDEAARFGREFAIHTLAARALAMSAGYHLDLCDYARHETLAEEARELARTTGFPPPAASAGIDLLLNYARRGEVGRAEALVDGVAAAVEHAAGFHGWLWRARLAQARAEIALARGGWEDALSWADRAIGQSRTTERPKYLALALGTRALALNGLGQSVLGMEGAREALTIAWQLDDPALILRLSTQLPVLSDDPNVALKVDAAAQRIRRGMSNPDLGPSVKAPDFGCRGGASRADRGRRASRRRPG